MAKSSKKVSDTAASDGASVPSVDGSTQTNGTTKPVNQAKAKSTTPKPRKTASRAKAAAKSPRPPSGKGAPTRKPKAAVNATPQKSFTDDDVRVRAYFIAERRILEGIPGSSADDWLEARRQLQAEADLGS